MDYVHLISTFIALAWVAWGLISGSMMSTSECLQTIVWAYSFSQGARIVYLTFVSVYQHHTKARTSFVFSSADWL